MNKKIVSTLVSSIISLIADNEINNLRVYYNPVYGLNIYETVENENGDIVCPNLPIGRENAGTILWSDKECEKQLQDAYYYIVLNFVKTNINSSVS